MEAYAVQPPSRDEGGEPVGSFVRDGHDVAGDPPGGRHPHQGSGEEGGERYDSTGGSRLGRHCAVPDLVQDVHGDCAQTCLRLSTASTISAIASAIGTPFFCVPSR